jgi:hypothetical protein
MSAPENPVPAPPPKATARPGPGAALKQVSLARMLAFSGGEIGTPGWPASNIHTDPAKARRAGLPNVIASGIQAEAYLIALLIDEMGEAWLSGGTLSVKHVGMLGPGDTVIPKIQRVADGAPRRFELRCERPDGRPVVVGEARFGDQ